MYTIEQLSELRNKRFGAINPDGELIICNIYQHFEVMGMKERYEEEYRKADDAINELLIQEQENCGDEYYHPAMHRFDADGEAREIILKEAYSEGWVRLGVWDQCNNKHIEAISTKDTMVKHLDRIKFIGEMLDCKLNLLDENDRRLNQKLKIY